MRKRENTTKISWSCEVSNYRNFKSDDSSHLSHGFTIKKDLADFREKNQLN